MNFLQGCMGCMGCMSGVGCYNNPSALAGTVRMSDSADGCGACMGCMRGTGCMNSFGLHGVDMGRMARSFDTLGALGTKPSAPGSIKVSEGSLDLSWGKLLSLVEEIRQQALASKDIVGTLKQAITSPKLLKPYVDKVSVIQTEDPVTATFKKKPEETKGKYFQGLIRSVHNAKNLQNLRSADSFLCTFFDVLQLILIPSNQMKVRFRELLSKDSKGATQLKGGLEQKTTVSPKVPPTKTIPNKGSFYVPEKKPLQLLLDRFYQFLQSQKIDYSTGLPMPSELAQSQDMMPEEGARIAPIKQVAMTNQDQAPASSATSDQAPVTEEKKEGLSGTQIALIAVGGIGILGAAWYFMSKKKD